MDHWTPEQVSKAKGIISSASKQKRAFIRFLDASLYWVLLMIAILANFILSVALVPFLLVFKGVSLYLSLFLISLSFGLLFSFILHGIDRIKSGQHIIAAVFIPAIALINVAIVAMLSNKLISILQLSTVPHNPFLVGGAYVLGYVLPEAIMHNKK